MPATNFPEYAQHLQVVLDPVVASGEATLVQLQIDQRSSLRGFITGALCFRDHSELHFREFVDASRAEPRRMYAYHYQRRDGSLIFRYDNAAHRPELPDPEHKHTPNQVRTAPAPTMAEVIDEILGE